MATSSMALRALVAFLFVLASASQLNAQPCTTSLYAAVNAAEDLQLLKVVIDAAGLKETLSDPTLKITVAAPNNAAFEALLKVLNASGLTLADVTAPESNKAASILLYHVIPVVAYSTSLKDKQVVPTLLGEGYNLTVDLTMGVKFIAAENSALVVKADIPVCDSVVHIIDTVMIPAPLAEIPNYMPPMGGPPPADNAPYYPPSSAPPPEAQPESAGKRTDMSPKVGFVTTAVAFAFALA